MAVSRMRNASGHNYRNSSFIVYLVMGRFHVPQNVFLIISDNFDFFSLAVTGEVLRANIDWNSAFLTEVG